MLDFLIDAAITLLVGATAGYCVAKVIDALSESFAELWRGLVAATKEIWGYVTEATEQFLASVSEFLDDNWSEIESSLRKQLGHTREWLVFVFQEKGEAGLGFMNPHQVQRGSSICTLDVVIDQENIQLPGIQNPIESVLNV